MGGISLPPIAFTDCSELWVRESMRRGRATAAFLSAHQPRKPSRPFTPL